MADRVSPPPTKRRRVGGTDGDAGLNDKEVPQSFLSIYSWNVNGIQPFIQKSITSFFTGVAPKKRETSQSDGETQKQYGPSLRMFLQRHHWPTLLFLQEVKISPDDHATQRSIEAAVSLKTLEDDGPEYVARFCLPTDKYNARGFGRKVYGVCSIIRKDFMDDQVERIRTVDWDCEGRFQVIETKGSLLPRLSIWNIYAVNGTTNIYKSPETGHVVGTRHDRKLAVHAHLLAESKRLEAEGYQIILAGDMNVARSKIDGFPNLRTSPEQHVRNRADFNKKFFADPDGLRAIDTFRHLHSEKRGYTYYPRGRPFGSTCDRVDLIICSSSLQNKLTTAGMLETPAERGPSDHCPLYATFDFGAGKS
ncbi:hypothetical protein LTR66_006239 [Elasticomyces elasticus]|nr:hypothetical protein LTR66_006239 [Elasticomyces elasticus]